MPQATIYSSEYLVQRYKQIEVQSKEPRPICRILWHQRMHELRLRCWKCKSEYEQDKGVGVCKNCGGNDIRLCRLVKCRACGGYTRITKRGTIFPPAGNNANRPKPRGKQGWHSKGQYLSNPNNPLRILNEARKKKPICH